MNGTWFTICDHHWTQHEASVVCHQLGYSSFGECSLNNLYYLYVYT